MNYQLWAEEYLKDAQNIKSAIDKEKENLKKAKNLMKHRRLTGEYRF